MNKKASNQVWLRKIGSKMTLSDLSYRGDNKWEMEIRQKDGKTTKPVCMEMISISGGKHYLIFTSDGNGDGEEFLTTREFYRVVELLLEKKLPKEMLTPALKAQIQMDTNRTPVVEPCFGDIKRYMINWQSYFRIRPSF